MCYNIESLCHRRLDWWQKDYIFIFVTIYSYEPIKYYYLSVSFLFIYNFFFRNGSTTKFYGSIYLTLKIKDQVAILVLHSPGEENVFWIDIKSLQNTHSLSLHSSSLLSLCLSLSTDTDWRWRRSFETGHSDSAILKEIHFLPPPPPRPPTSHRPPPPPASLHP